MLCKLHGRSYNKRKRKHSNDRYITYIRLSKDQMTKNIHLISTDQSPACLSDRPAAFVFSSNSLVWLIFYACGCVYVRLLLILCVCASVAIYPPNLIFYKRSDQLLNIENEKKTYVRSFLTSNQTTTSLSPFFTFCSFGENAKISLSL